MTSTAASRPLDTSSRDLQGAARKVTTQADDAVKLRHKWIIQVVGLGGGRWINDADYRPPALPPWIRGQRSATGDTTAAWCEPTPRICLRTARAW